MTTISSPFTLENVTSHSRDESHCDLYTATLWTLHLRVDTDTTVQTVLAQVQSTGAECLTGEYIGGDSFHEWCEPYGHNHEPMGRALHIDFTAANLPTAKAAALAILTEAQRRHPDGRFLRNTHSHLTTGGDWAEGVEIL